MDLTSISYNLSDVLLTGALVLSAIAIAWGASKVFSYVTNV